MQLFTVWWLITEYCVQWILCIQICHHIQQISSHWVKLSHTQLYPVLYYTLPTDWVIENGILFQVCCIVFTIQLKNSDWIHRPKEETSPNKVKMKSPFSMSITVIRVHRWPNTKLHLPIPGSAFMLERNVKHDIEGNPLIQHRIPAWRSNHGTASSLLTYRYHV